MFKKTITHLFMVPVLGLDREDLKKNGFVDAFSYMENEEEDDDIIYLLYYPKNIELFRSFLENMYSRNRTVVEDYALGEFYVSVHKLPKEFKKDFSIVRKGKYSFTSPEFQAQFNKNVTVFMSGRKIEDISLQHQIFAKSEKLKTFWENSLNTRLSINDELWERFDRHRETLTLDKLTKLAEELIKQ